MNRQAFNNDINAFFALIIMPSLHCARTLSITLITLSQMFFSVQIVAQKDSAALPLVPKISECRWPRPQAAL